MNLSMRLSPGSMGGIQHRAKRRRYLADPGGDAKPERVANIERRFSDNDEIRFCLRSIRNYAPWVRTIWLVTDEQVPAAIDRRRAERENIRIVDHREIFRGYEQLLPTFNSYAIESMLWRIEEFGRALLVFQRRHDVGRSGGAYGLLLKRRQSHASRPLEQLEEQPPDGGISFFGTNKLLGAEMLGYAGAFLWVRPRCIHCCAR